MRRGLRIATFGVVCFAIVGIAPAIVGAADGNGDCPAAGVYHGTSTVESYTPMPPGSGGESTPPKSPVSGAVLIHCESGGRISTFVSPSGPVVLTQVAPGRYHGSALYPTGCGWVPPGPSVEVDLEISGDSVTQRSTSKAGAWPTQCAGNTVYTAGVVRVFHGSRAGAPATTLPPPVATTSGGATSAGAAAAGTSAGTASRIEAMSPRQRDNVAAVHAGDLSTIPASLQAPSEAFTNAGRLAQNALLAALLVLLLVFPAELFNSTFDKNHARIEAAWRRRFRRDPAGTPRTSTRGRRTVVYLVVAFAGALLAGFLDPHFGFSTASMGMLAGVTVSILFGAALGGVTNREYRRIRHHGTDAKLVAVPAGLAIAAVCVVVSRAVHFQPGYLYGLVGGFSFTVALGRRAEGQARFVAFVTGLAVAIAGWIVFVPVSNAANNPHPTFAVLAANAFLAAVFIGGIEGALFTLVPLRFLPGHHVVRWSKVAWTILAFVTAFLFVDVLLRPETGYLGKSSTASALVTYGLFAVFGAASVAFWGWFRLHPDPTSEPAAEAGVPALSVSSDS